MATGIVLNGGGTATWTIAAADCSALPLGPLNVSLQIWYGAKLQDTVSGTINIRDTSLAATTTTATWSNVLSVALSQTSVVQGSQFVSTLTIKLNGVLTAPSYIDWRITSQPLGSITPIQVVPPTSFTISGTVYYSDINRVVLGTWAGAMVRVFNDSGTTVAIVPTDSNGQYSFVPTISLGVQLQATVASQLAPNGSMETGTTTLNATFPAQIVINVTCQIVGG